MQRTTLNRRKPEKVGFSSARLQRLTAGIRGIIDRGELPGLAAAVSRKGKIVYTGQSGLLDVESQKAIRPDSIFRIYSITKLATSVALMSLLEEGKIRLNDPVSAYVPEFREVRVCAGETKSGLILEEPVREVDIRDLLIHTSGIGYAFTIEDPSISSLYDEAALFRPDRSLADMMLRLSRIPLLFQPGARYHYGHSTDVAGRIIEIVSGQELDRFFDEKIFGPLRMNDTGFFVPPDKIDRLSALYVPSAKGSHITVDKPSASIYRSRPELLIPGSGLVSTALDCLKFGQMLLNGGSLSGTRILGRKTVEYMSRNHLAEELLPGTGFGQGFCLQVCVDPSRAAPMVSKGAFCKGGAGGSIIWMDPQEELCFVVMAQLISPELVRKLPYLFSEAPVPEGDPPPPGVDTIALLHTLIYQALE